ncbi:hypothetical protein ACP4J4_20330 (plasmid) [Aureimonas ureilytica]|uniref:hypothetical protein n=1 Tax=Aureimonas ureilytica TaxID=401562 RepID=UPI003CE67C77
MGALKPGAKVPDSEVPAVFMTARQSDAIEDEMGDQTFEMAVYPEGYRTTAAILVGSFAIHPDKAAGGWAISHAATGLFLPGIHPQTKEAALKAAEAMDAAADWSKITRSNVPAKPNMGMDREEWQAALQVGEAATGQASLAA